MMTDNRAQNREAPSELKDLVRLDRRRFQWSSLVLISPMGLLLFLLFLGPVGYAFYLGFTNLQLIGINSINYRFTGLTNLIALWKDREFYHSLLLTMYFVIGSGAIGSTVAGLALALLMERALPSLRATVGAVAVLACILPPVTVAVVWYSVTTAGGVFPEMIGMGRDDLLYKSPMLVVSLANGWSLCGLSMLIFAAALKNIPRDLFEAAMLDDATALQRFFRITLPMLRPTVMTSVLLMTLLSFGNFTLVFLMTGGGPEGRTNILPVYSYLQAFAYHRLGYGALLGNVIVVISALLGVIFVAINLLTGMGARRGHAVAAANRDAI
jgi:multiple sugar transport system permease protein